MEIDNSDFFNLCAFLNTEDYDSGVKIIHGKEYKLSNSPPAWL